MKYSGVFTALVTPFKNGELDIDAYMSLVDRQVDAGINGLVLTGTTGEAATLNAEEKKKIYSTVVDKYKNKVPIIAGTGTNCTETTIKTSKLAKDCGVDALLIVTPYYNKPTQEGLYAHFEKCSQEVDLPIVLYNVPGRTGINLSPETVKSLSEISNIIAVKEAGTFSQMNDVIKLNRSSISILSGDDFTFLPFLSIGGHGVISVVSNIVPKKMLDIYDSALKGNYSKAQEVHHDIYSLIKILFIESNPTPTKEALKQLGLIENEVRLPLVPPRSTSIEKIREELKKQDLL